LFLQLPCIFCRFFADSKKSQVAKNDCGQAFTHRDNEQRTNVSDLSLPFCVTAARSNAGEKTMISLRMIALVVLALVPGLVLFSLLMLTTRNETSPRQATALVNCHALVNHARQGNWEAKLAQAYSTVDTKTRRTCEQVDQVDQHEKNAGNFALLLSPRITEL
jgi:hypothetical protein